MNEFLNSVKSDLLDRRMLPYVAVVAVACAAALAYAGLSGSGSGSPVASPIARVTLPKGLPTSSVTVNKAVAETTNGSHEQRRGVARNPFLSPIPPTKVTTVTATSSSSTSSSSPSSSSSTSTSAPSSSGGSSEPSSGGTPTSSPPKSSAPAKQKVVYHVTVLFGAVPAGSPPLTQPLTEFPKLKLSTALPNAKQPLLVFRGVTPRGRSATFSLVGEAILHGNAACLPNTSQCLAIDLQPGRYEQLEYLSPTGEAVTYELRVVSITASKATAAGVKSMLAGESKEGRAVLRSAGLTEIPLLRSSSQVGVLVFEHPHAAAAGTRVAPSGAHGA